MKSTFLIIVLQTLVGYFTPLAYAETKSANTSTAREIEIVPGNSYSRDSLTQRGFVEDPVRQSKDYLVKDQIMARMENDGVELSYSLRGSKNVKFDGLSVVSSDLVNKILHGP